MQRRIIFRGMTDGVLLLVAAIVCLLTVKVNNPASAAVATTAGVTSTDSRIVTADTEPQNWLTTGRNYGETRFSPLHEINDSNAGSLGLVWSYDFDTKRGQESTPLAVDGVLYTTSAWSKIQAFDAVTGKLLWQFDPKVPGAQAVKACCDVVNRGVAYWNGNVYVGTIDGRLVAVDAKSGHQVWSAQTTDPSQNYTITGAPRVVKGRVIIGNGGAEYGVRGYVSAYDAATGKMAWRFFIVPGKPGVKDGAASDPILEKLASKTWSGNWWNEAGGGGGGTAWDSMAYDPDLDLLYIGTGNSAYWNKKYRSPGEGDNLFVGSILALRPETGEYVWHFQETPGDEWDYTSTQHMVLTDLVIEGKMRKVLLHAPKNGVFYVLDRATGQLISAKPYIPINWAKSIDPVTGRPDIVPEARYDRTGGPWRAKPSGYGGHNWQPMAFNPMTGLVYLPAFELASTFISDPNFKPNPVGMNLGTDVTASMQANYALFKQNPPKGYLLAWDPVRQKEAWRVPMPSYWNGGVLATAGNIVVEGNGGGFVNVFEAATGQKLWSFDAQTGVVAAPMTFAVNGKQYVTIVVGAPRQVSIGGGSAVPPAIKGGERAIVAQPPKGRVLTFALGGTAKLPQPEVGEAYIPKAPQQFAGVETVVAGHHLYDTTCMVCHGLGAEGDGTFPDLRHSSIIGDKNAWKSIVWDGVLEANGMASFKKNYNVDQLDALRAYVISQARIEQNLQ
jgi:quinohemoprotein ethanol dehydrogenase